MIFDDAGAYAVDGRICRRVQGPVEFGCRIRRCRNEPERQSVGPMPGVIRRGATGIQKENWHGTWEEDSIRKFHLDVDNFSASISLGIF